MKIALISCSKEKKDYPCPARELYSASTLFSLSYVYAKQRADKIYILSAKYGLVPEDRILEPYNQTLNEMSRAEQLDWASRVLRALQKECDLTADHFLILAGNNYCKDLVSSLPNYELPLACKQSSKISQNSPESIPLLAVPGGIIRHKVYQSCVVSL